MSRWRHIDNIKSDSWNSLLNWMISEHALLSIMNEFVQLREKLIIFGNCMCARKNLIVKLVHLRRNHPNREKTPLLYFLLSLVVRKLSQIHFESLNNNFGSSAVCTLISLGSCFVLEESRGSFILNLQSTIFGLNLRLPKIT